MKPDDIDEVAEAIRAEFLKEFGDQYDLAVTALTVLTDGLSLLDGQGLSDQPARVRTWLAVGHRNALGAALTVLSRGYFREAATLIRAAFEDWGTQKYLAKHPEKAPAYAEIDVTAPFRRKKGAPSFADIWKKLQGEGPEEAPRVYAWLCSYTHPSAAGLRSTYHRDAEGFWIHLSPYFDTRLARQALAYWFQVAPLQLRATQDLQALVLGSADPEWSARGVTLSSELVEATRELASGIAADALDEIGGALKREGVSLEDWIESAREERGTLVEKLYGIRGDPPKP